MTQIMNRRAADKSPFASKAFLADGGEMGALMRSTDWAKTPLGPPEGWPEILKMTLRLALTSNHPMMVYWGPAHIQFYNDGLSKTLGPERHPSILGQPAKDCWGEIWDTIGPQIESILAGGPPTWHDEQLLPITRHGHREDVWWTYGFSPIQGNAGVEGVLVICNDVTEERRAKDELKQANAQLRDEIRRREQVEQRLPSLFAQAPGLMAILRGPDHVFEFSNAAYRQFFGERQLIGLTVRQALPDIEGQGFFEQLDQVYATGQAHAASDVPVVMMHPGNSTPTERHVNFVFQPMLDADNLVSGIFIEAFDVTEHYLSQKALEVTQKRLQEGLEAAKMTVWDLDLASGNIVFSANAAQVFGGMWPTVAQAWECIHPDDIEHLHSARQVAIATCSEYEDVVRLIRPNDGGILWLQVSGKVTCDIAGKPVSIHGISLDVSAQKRAEEALKIVDRRKDEFLATLAHELRNPLAPISSAAQMLKRLGKDEPHIAKTSEIIARQAGHMTNLINDLLDVSRIKSGAISINQAPVSINHVIIKAVEQVMPFMESRRHSFTFQEAPIPVQVSGEETRLVQIVTNLLQNAAKFTPEAGFITLSTEIVSNHVAITVSDNGIGIEEKFLEHVFDLFSQAKPTSDRAHGGLGLGLALVKNLVELHGGKIIVNSAGLGLGSTFTVLLPVGQPAVSSQMPLAITLDE